MDLATILGLVIGIGGILLGNFFEGGHVASLLQFTAFVIVMMGTFGAVMVSNRSKDLKLGFKLFRKSFREQNLNYEEPIAEIIECARIAKKETPLALEPKLPTLRSPMLADILRNVVDGVDPKLTRQIFDNIIHKEEQNMLAAGKIWLDAGGFSPTIGIIGAVLGLIHVMGNLTDTSKLGGGIAVAFVATVYGVGFANLVFIPIGNKIKKNIHEVTKHKLMILDGALMITSGVNPQLIEQKLESYKSK
ncbi:MAG: flagellar motor protein MotA [Pseudobdellovibrio sp.]|jgi:chemotaxis protein MotA|nr:flagellar motor protein MotA [Pseudobdellovibrio sp.]